MPITIKKPAIEPVVIAEPRRCPFQVLEPVDRISGWSHGAGNPYPAIPNSQRQYDGDNPFDYCEPIYLR